MKTVLTVGNGQLSQCQKPRGWLGRFVLWNMNYRHSKATDWGLGHRLRREGFHHPGRGLRWWQDARQASDSGHAGEGLRYRLFEGERCRNQENECSLGRNGPRRGSTSLCVSASVSGWNVRSRDSRGDALLVARLGG